MAFIQKIMSVIEEIDGSQRWIGASVCVDSTLTMIGCAADPSDPSKDSAIYTCNKSATGTWTSTSLLMDHNLTMAGSGAGESVSIKGMYGIIGVPRYLSAANDGTAILVKRKDTSPYWTTIAIIDPPVANIAGRFGCSVAMSTDQLAVVGARSDPGSGGTGVGRGAVYLYQRYADDDWRLIKTLYPSDPIDSHFFGCSVDIYGDYVVVGAYGDIDNAGVSTNAGAVYVFEKDAGGIGQWGQIQKIVASDGTAGDYFGSSLSVYKNVIAVGAPTQSHDTYFQEGAVYLYQIGSTGLWREFQKILPQSSNLTHSRALFGTSVDIDEDYLAIGYPGDVAGRGSVDIYLSKKNFSFFQKIEPSATGTPLDFGCAVSVSGNAIAVGAKLSYWTYPPPSDGGRGGVYIFENPLPVLRLAQKFDVTNQYVPTKASLYLKRVGRNTYSYFTVSSSSPLVIDATNFLDITQSNVKYCLSTDMSNFTGNGYMFMDSSQTGVSDEDFSILNYPFKSSSETLYYLAVRAKSAVNHAINFSVYIDGVLVLDVSNTSDPSTWEWIEAGSFVVPDTGLHVLSIKMKDTGDAIDKIYLRSSLDMPYGYGPNYTPSPFITLHLRVYSEGSPDTPDQPLLIYDYKNTVSDVVADDWYNFDLNPIGSAISFTGSYFLVLSSSGNTGNNFVVWELVDNDEYFDNPSAIRI